MKSSTIFAAALAFAIPVRAFIMGDQEVVDSFTNPAVAVTNLTWSDGISLSTNGLGWDGESNAYKDFWIQSVPVAIGTSWRPAGAVGVTWNIDPEGAGDLFVRYSADKKHWSTWQVLTGPRSSVRVPVVARVEYDELFSRFRKLDVPWKNDEEAAVKWILEQQPDFFRQTSTIHRVPPIQIGRLNAGQPSDQTNLFGFGLGRERHASSSPELGL